MTYEFWQTYIYIYMYIYIYIYILIVHDIHIDKYLRFFVYRVFYDMWNHFQLLHLSVTTDHYDSEDIDKNVKNIAGFPWLFMISIHTLVVWHVFRVSNFRNTEVWILTLQDKVLHTSKRQKDIDHRKSHMSYAWTASEFTPQRSYF